MNNNIGQLRHMAVQHTERAAVMSVLNEGSP